MNRRIKIRQYRIKLPAKAGRAETPIRMVVIGDLHNRRFGKSNQKLVDQIITCHPDLILSVGDLMVSRPGRDCGTEIGTSLLKRLSCECPVYCVNGNHEFRTKIYPDSYPGVYERMKRELHTANILLLEDAWADMEIKGARLRIYGYELPAKYYKKLDRKTLAAEEIRKQIGEPGENRFNILLAHNPIYFESYALWGADLTLGGHLHGGLVRLPLIGGLVSPQISLFPRYDCGKYEKYGRKMLVTAGLGTHSFAFRINNPAEFMLVELYSARTAGA